MYRVIDDFKPKKGICTFELAKAYRAVYGLGEKFDAINQKGKIVKSIVREKCFNQGEYTYCPIPFFMTPNGFGIYVDTYVEVTFDFTVEGMITITFPVDSFGNPSRIYYFQGTMKEILSDYRKLTGMPRLFPKWVLGAWMSSNRWKCDSDIREQLKENKDNKFSHNVMVIEPWSDESTHYIVNGSEVRLNGNGDIATPSMMNFKHNKIWPNFPQLITDIHNEGIKVLLWVVPIYSEETGKESRTNYDALVKENKFVKKKKYVVMKKEGGAYIIPKVWCIGSMIPDFTNEAATKYWFDRFQYLKDLGVDGFKTDGGEFVHEQDVVFSDGKTGIEGVNEYPEMYEKAFSEFVGKDGIIYSRSGGVKTPTNSILWAGDQESTWDEFRACVKAGISSGLSGISAWGYDIAGFSGYLPSKELYLRSVQFATFLPIMQWHSDPVINDKCDPTLAWKINDRSPWNMSRYHKDKDFIDLIRRKFDMHYNLIPYQYMLQKESSETGIPAIRHLALEFSEDVASYNIETEFMLGDSLLIAPVLNDYVDKIEVYLPDDTWYNIYNNKKFKGGHHKFDIEEDTIPVFMRNNRCIPLNLLGKRIESSVGNDLSKYKELTFLVSGVGNYHFYDDLGNDITFTWDKSHVLETSNKLLTKYNVLHIEKAKIYRK